jgi:hypothetical protein
VSASAATRVPRGRVPRPCGRALSRSGVNVSLRGPWTMRSRATGSTRERVRDDIGGAIAALLGDGNRWVTGQRIEVSGGFHL